MYVYNVEIQYFITYFEEFLNKGDKSSKFDQ